MKRLLICTLLLLTAAAADADRLVLTPRGFITTPGTLRAEYFTAQKGGRNFGFLSTGLPLGPTVLELEAERADIGNTVRETLHAQYSITGNAFADLAPVVSVGVRDIMNRGRERRAYFVAMSKTIGLSVGQERFVKDLKVHLGLGSSRLEGVFGGVQMRLPFNLEARGEYAARRWNGSVSLPILRNLHARAYTLDGTFFYGGTLNLRF
jgi:hypothetical protein